MSSFATEKQINFILSLDSQREPSNLSQSALDYLDNLKGGNAQPISKKAASQIIDLFLNAPRKPREVVKNHSVKDGRYAIKIEGKVRFFHVNTPDYGRWIGHTFVGEQFGDIVESVRNKQFRDRVLVMIDKDVNASARYGQELGICGRCSRPLTTEESRAIGIGPICRTK